MEMDAAGMFSRDIFLCNIVLCTRGVFRFRGGEEGEERREGKPGLEMKRGRRPASSQRKTSGGATLRQ